MFGANSISVFHCYKRCRYHLQVHCHEWCIDGSRAQAGILRAATPAVVGLQSPDALAVIRACAAELGAPLAVAGEDWHVAESARAHSFFLSCLFEGRRYRKQINCGC